jgi:uncharacterized protein YndB with AHSA1/START domain
MSPFEASATIEASPEEVWAVLADSAGWPTWDSGVDGVDGVLAPGKQVTIRSAVAPGRAFPVRVTRFEPGACLELTGGFRWDCSAECGPTACSGRAPRPASRCARNTAVR